MTACPPRSARPKRYPRSASTPASLTKPLETPQNPSAKIAIVAVVWLTIRDLMFFCRVLDGQSGPPLSKPPTASGSSNLKITAGGGKDVGDHARAGGGACRRAYGRCDSDHRCDPCLGFMTGPLLHGPASSLSKQEDFVLLSGHLAFFIGIFCVACFFVARIILLFLRKVSTCLVLLGCLRGAGVFVVPSRYCTVGFQSSRKGTRSRLQRPCKTGND